MAGGQALNGQRATIFLLDPDEVEFITDPKDPLCRPDRLELPLQEAVVLSIMAHGVRKVIHVRKDGDRAQVIDGTQRVKSAREANKRLRAEGKEPVRVKAIVEKGSEADLFGLMVLANRMNQAEDGLVEAELIKKYLDLGRTDLEASLWFGKTVSHIEQAKKLFDCSANVQKAVRAGTLSVSAAAKLAGRSRAEQDAKLEQAKAGGVSKRSGKISVKAIAEATRKAPAKPSAKASADSELVRLRLIEQLAQPILKAADDWAETCERGENDAKAFHHADQLERAALEFARQVREIDGAAPKKAAVR